MLVIGSDHGGFVLKEKIKKYLDEIDLKYIDCGCKNEERVDYPNIVKDVITKMKKEINSQGILICRTGIGMSITANKYKDIRCALCYTEETAKLSKMHNNSNVLSIGADIINESEAIIILRTWLATEFDEGRHKDRVDLISEIEESNMK